MSEINLGPITINSDWSPIDAQQQLGAIAKDKGYLFNPLEHTLYGKTTRSVLKILVNDIVYILIWHDFNLYKITTQAYGFDNPSTFFEQK